MLRITHLGDPATGERPSVGTPVRAGVTPLGTVHDFSGVVEQELASSPPTRATTSTSSSIRTQAALIL